MTMLRIGLRCKSWGGCAIALGLMFAAAHWSRLDSPFEWISQVSAQTPTRETRIIVGQNAAPREFVYVYKGTAPIKLPVVTFRDATGRRVDGRPEHEHGAMFNPGEFMFIRHIAPSQYGGLNNSNYTFESATGLVASGIGGVGDELFARLGFVLMRTDQYPPAARAGRLLDDAARVMAQEAKARQAALLAKRKAEEEAGRVTLFAIVAFGLVAVVMFIVARESLAKARAAREKRERDNREALRQDELRKSAVRERLSHLANLLAQSRSDCESLPGLVQQAESRIAEAQTEFLDRAFAPFWDAVEDATNILATYQHLVARLNDRVVSYQKTASELGTPAPRLDLPVEQLRDARPAASQLASMVRRAQRDFEFATIYEQRKSNQILVAGFSTLASAIYSVGDSISSSLGALVASLGTSLSTLDRQTELLMQHVNIATMNGAAGRMIAQESLSVQRDQSAKLDNIQRGRKPGL